MTKKTLLITGASGFIGSHFIRKISGDFDIISIGTSTPKFEIAEHIQTNFMTGLDPRKLPSSIDVIAHFAQANRYHNLNKDAEEVFKANVKSTFDLLMYASNAQASKFLFASSGSVYSQNSERVKESDESANLKNLYAASKTAAERLILPFEANFDTSILRIFYPYGPGQKNRLISNLIDTIRSKSPVKIAGKKYGVRIAPLYIDDLTSRLSFYLSAKHSGITNVGSPHAISYNELANLIGKLLNEDVTKQFELAQDPQSLLPDVEKLAIETGQTNFTTIEKGLLRTIEDNQA